MSHLDELHLAEALVGLVLAAQFMRAAAGRLAPKVAIGALLFLVTRWPVVLVGLAGTTGWAVVFLTMPAPGHAPMALAPALAFSAFLGLGVAALVVGPGFLVYRAFHEKIAFALEPGEVVLDEWLGNHFLGGESRGGHLILTSRRLGFRPHRFNVQLDTWSTKLEAIRSMKTEGARFLVVGTAADPKPVWVVTPTPRDLADRLQALAALPEPQRVQNAASAA